MTCLASSAAIVLLVGAQSSFGSCAFMELTTDILDSSLFPCFSLKHSFSARRTSVTFSSIRPPRLSRPAGIGAIPTYPTPPLMLAIQIAPPARTCPSVSTYVLFCRCATTA